MAQKPAIIYRPFLWLEVKQDIDTMFYNATDVEKAYLKKTWKEKRVREFLSNKSTKEFIKQLINEENFKSGDCCYLEKDIVNARKWKYWWTRMSSKLLLDFMMWLSPEFKSKAYDFILDWFILAWKRNELKEWYKKMAKAICDNWNANYREEATMINVLVTWSCAANQRARLGIDKMKQMDELQITNANLIKAWLLLEQRKDILVKSL